MFLIIVDYKKPLEEVERYLAEHRAFLDRYFVQGKLLCTCLLYTSPSPRDA